MPTSQPLIAPTFLLVLQPDGSRDVIEIVASQVTLTQDVDYGFARPFLRAEPRTTRVAVEGYVARQVHYAADADPDFTPTPQPAIEAPRQEIER